MRKLIIFITLFAMAFAAPDAIAQLSSSAYTHFTQPNFQTYKEPVNIALNQGFKFVGTKITSTNNGQVTSISYFGSAIFPDGGRIITTPFGYAFNENLQAHNGTFWAIEPTGEVTQIEMRNGQEVSSFPVNREYYIEDNCIVFPKTQAELEAEAAAYGSSYYNGSSSTSGSSNYNSHSATCAGCNGTGKCRQCNGEGTKIVNGHKIKCDLCHSSGRCQNCAGVGKKY